MIAWQLIAAWLRACADAMPADRCAGTWLACAAEIEAGTFVSSYRGPRTLQLAMHARMAA